MRKIALGLTPILLTMSTPAFAQAAQWRVSEVSGNVRIVEQGRARAATRGALLATGATIATAPDGRAVLVRGREFVVVSPRSQLRIPEAEQQRGVFQVIADWGTALFRIERRETPHFGVQTPYLAAVVKGTIFTVTVGPAGASVQVTEGAVEVSTVDGGAAELARTGMIVSVAAADLYQLNVDGETSRSIRSSGAPTAGVVTVPAAAQGAYAGPPAEPTSLGSTVAEERVPVEDATDGLVEESEDLPVADIRDQERPAAGNPPAQEPGGAGADAGNSGGDRPAGDAGNGGDQSGAGDDGDQGAVDEDRGGDAGNGGDNGQSGDNGNGGSGDHGNGGDNGNGGGNGGGSDNSGSGSGNGGGNGNGGDNGNGGGNGGGSDSSGSGGGNGGGNGNGGDNGNGGGNGGSGDNSGSGGGNGNGGGSGDSSGSGGGNGNGGGNGGGSDDSSGSGGGGSGGGNGGSGGDDNSGSGGGHGGDDGDDHGGSGGGHGGDAGEDSGHGGGNGGHGGGREPD